jgi:hypothetical protein
MAGLVRPSTTSFRGPAANAWMPGPSPGMTAERYPMEAIPSTSERPADPGPPLRAGAGGAAHLVRLV